MPSQSIPLQQPGAAIGDLELVRHNALQRVEHFHTTVVDLEVKRMNDSEAGSMLWETVCADSFVDDYDEMRNVCSPIDNANLQIDTLFKEAAETSLNLLNQARADINSARSVTRISEVSQALKRNLTLNSEARKRDAVAIMQRLRRDLHEIFGSFGLHEEWYPAVYRMILGLVPDGTYHPDPIPDDRPYHTGLMLELFLGSRSTLPQRNFDNFHLTLEQNPRRTSRGSTSRD